MVTGGVAGVLVGAALAGIAVVAAASRSNGSSGVETGTASWYGPQHDGRRTASGERFDMNDLTAAHPTYAFGTRVRVTLLANGRSVVVRINDRFPNYRNRVIDLSKAAAREIGLMRRGTGRVRLEVLEQAASR
jgi:peptidoglycan lytic transglycosylase